MGLTVLRAGSRTTVEDLGRSGAARWGVPPGGVFDPLALIAANRLVGNPDDAAGLEITLGGPDLRNDSGHPLSIALVGADLSAAIDSGSCAGPPLSPAAPDRASTVPPGGIVKTGFARDGARAWMAIGGGIEVPRFLGSRSTCIAGGFGGHAGRPLRSGDRLALGPPAPAPPGLVWRDPARVSGDPISLRILPGPQRPLWSADPLEALESTLWIVSGESDRTGIRVHAADPAVAARLGGIPGIPPEGTTMGSIQIPPAGEPVMLGPDRPVTGGYAKAALVVAADVGRLAQLRPGDRFRFQRVDLAHACSLAAARERALPPGLRMP